MEILVQLIFSGIAIGMIYAVIAFGYQLTFATSGTLNFGQGEAEQFKASVAGALEGALNALTQSREEINNAVAVLAGEAPAGGAPMGDAGAMPTRSHPARCLSRTRASARR